MSGDINCDMCEGSVDSSEIPAGGYFVHDMHHYDLCKECADRIYKLIQKTRSEVGGSSD